jgi:L-lactate dehydrogenase
MHDSDLVLPVAIVQPEVEGIPDVCVSLPLLVDKRGATMLAYPVLDDPESHSLRESAAAVKRVSDTVVYKAT